MVLFLWVRLVHFMSHLNEDMVLWMLMRMHVVSYATTCINCEPTQLEKPISDLARQSDEILTTNFTGT